MKTPTPLLSRSVSLAALLAMAAFALPQMSQARDHGPWGWGWHRGPGWHDPRAAFFAYPRSSFVITLGNGYAGRGYYYGPPGVPYYYQGPGITFYSSRAAVPGEYWGTHSVAASVQRALADRGYYRGPPDGIIGLGTRRAISLYQTEHGLAPTGEINESLLRSLHLE